MKPSSAQEMFVHWPLGFAMAVRPLIFLPKNAGQWDLIAQRAIVAHERVHHRQQRALGLARFVFAYYFSRRLRWRIERAGYRREFAVYRKYGRRPDPQRYARMLSSRFYAWMVSYAEALIWCESTIARLNR